MRSQWAMAPSAAFRMTAPFGEGATTTAANDTALGAGASVTATNSVALGAGSTDTRANTVSVGNGTINRQIINVAAGTQGTDAVNLSQLQAATERGAGHRAHRDDHRHHRA